MLDMVNHPNHYASNRMSEITGVECLEFSRCLVFDVGNAFKYVWRCLDKGTAEQDLDKAVFYLNDHVKKGVYSHVVDDESIKKLRPFLFELPDDSVSDFEKMQLEVLAMILYSPVKALVEVKKLKKML